MAPISTAALLEGQLALGKGLGAAKNLSVQQVIDCSKSTNGNSGW